MTPSKGNEMKNYYLPGEEKFGPILSRLYSFSVKIPITKDFYAFVIEDIKRYNATSILDVGTGPGEIPIRLSKNNKLKVYAIDPSPSMIKIASKKAAAKKSSVSFKIGSSRNIPFKRNFDIIMSSISFHHWKKKKDALLYMSEFLTNGGVINIYEYELGHMSSPFKFIGGSHGIEVSDIYGLIKGTNLKVKSLKRNKSWVRVSISK